MSSTPSNPSDHANGGRWMFLGRQIVNLGKIMDVIKTKLQGDVMSNVKPELLQIKAGAEEIAQDSQSWANEYDALSAMSQEQDDSLLHNLSAAGLIVDGAVLKIQSQWRMRRCHKRLESAKSAVLKLQNWSRKKHHRLSHGLARLVQDKKRLYRHANWILGFAFENTRPPCLPIGLRDIELYQVYRAHLDESNWLELFEKVFYDRNMDYDSQVIEHLRTIQIGLVFCGVKSFACNYTYARFLINCYKDMLGQNSMGKEKIAIAAQWCEANPIYRTENEFKKENTTGREPTEPSRTTLGQESSTESLFPVERVPLSPWESDRFEKPDPDVEQDPLDSTTFLCSKSHPKFGLYTKLFRPMLWRGIWKERVNLPGQPIKWHLKLKKGRLEDGSFMYVTIHPDHLPRFRGMVEQTILKLASGKEFVYMDFFHWNAAIHIGYESFRKVTYEGCTDDTYRATVSYDFVNEVDVNSNTHQDYVIVATRKRILRYSGDCVSETDFEQNGKRFDEEGSGRRKFASDAPTCTGNDLVPPSTYVVYTQRSNEETCMVQAFKNMLVLGQEHIMYQVPAAENSFADMYEQAYSACQLNQDLHTNKKKALNMLFNKLKGKFRGTVDGITRQLEIRTIKRENEAFDPLDSIGKPLPELPILVSLRTKPDTARGHCVVLFRGFIYDSLLDKPIPITKQNLDWVCDGKSFSKFRWSVQLFFTVTGAGKKRKKNHLSNSSKKQRV